jgi:HopA1 effector protein family
VAYEPLPSASVLLGGRDGVLPSHPSVVSQRPAAGAVPRGPAAGPWPDWAIPQLGAAVRLADTAPEGVSVASLLYRNWFNRELADPGELPAAVPLAGLYRAAHAGSRTRLRRGSLSVVARHDVLRSGGWWRTWGEQGTPPRGRHRSVRLLLTPRADCLPEFVATVTGTLLDGDVPWSFACSTDPWRIARSGCAVLDLPGLDAVPGALLADLAPFLHPVTPPLCLPLAAGVGAAEYPDNGMTFGEHRCHLVALALRHRRRSRDPLSVIATVFTAYGIEPGRPYRVA